MKVFIKFYKKILILFRKNYVHFYEGWEVENLQYNWGALVRHNGIKFMIVFIKFYKKNINLI